MRKVYDYLWDEENRKFYSLDGEFLGRYFYIPAKDGGWDLLSKPALNELRYYVKKGSYLIK